MAYDKGDPESRGPIQVVVAAVFIALSWSSLILRLYVRGRMIKLLGWDDYAMVAATVFLTGFCGLQMKIVSLGGGSLHTTLDKMEAAVYYIIAAEDLYLLAMVLLKISLGLFFLRIVVKTWQRYVIYGAMAFSTLFQFSHVWIITFLCGNPKYFLSRYIAKECVPEPVQLGLTYEQAVVSTVTDIALFCVPIAVLRHANIDRKAKISVGAILLLGSLGIIGSIVRFIYLPGLIGYEDFFWNSANYAIWSMIEPGTGITAGNLACIRPLVKRMLLGARLTITKSFNASISARGRGGRASAFLLRCGLGLKEKDTEMALEKELTDVTNTSREESPQLNLSNKESSSSNVGADPSLTFLNFMNEDGFDYGFIDGKIGSDEYFKSGIALDYKPPEGDAIWSGSSGETVTCCVGGPGVVVKTSSEEGRTDDQELASRHHRFVSLGGPRDKRSKVYTRLRQNPSASKQQMTGSATATPGSLPPKMGVEQAWRGDLEKGLHVQVSPGRWRGANQSPHEQREANEESDDVRSHQEQWERIERGHREPLWVKKAKTKRNGDSGNNERHGESLLRK